MEPVASKVAWRSDRLSSTTPTRCATESASDADPDRMRCPAIVDVAADLDTYAVERDQPVAGVLIRGPSPVEHAPELEHLGDREAAVQRLFLRQKRGPTHDPDLLEWA